MKYVIYHSSITGDRSAVEKLRKHAHNGEVVGEFFDNRSASEDDQPNLDKAIEKCRETDAILLVFDLSAIGKEDPGRIEGVQVKFIT